MPRSWKRGRQAAWQAVGAEGGPHGAFDVAAVELAGADEEDVAFFDLEAATLLRGEDVFRHDAFAALQPVDAAHQGHVDEDAAGDEALLGGDDGADGGAEAGGDEVGGLAVVGLTVPEEVGEAIDVGDGDAVEDHADVVDGGGVGPRLRPYRRWPSLRRFRA